MLNVSATTVPVVTSKGDIPRWRWALASEPVPGHDVKPYWRNVFWVPVEKMR